MKKKIFALIACAIMLNGFSSVFALEKLYEKEKSEIISSGVTLKSYDRFTDKGWLAINIVEVDLKDKNTSVKLMNSENGLMTFQTVSQMANKNKAIAAINGDFFNGTSKKGNTIGLSISDGDFLTSTYYENEIKDTFATFVLDEKDNAWFDYFHNKITIENTKNDEVFAIGEYNKVSSNYIYPVIYTPEWGEYSIGNVDNGIPLTEMVVKNGKVTEIRDNGEPVEIPSKGYVVSTIGETAERMKEIFSKGNKVKLNIDLELDIDEIEMAVSGGAMLLVDGEVPEKFSANITGSHPRTAIGLSEDEETLYLITVDGRMESSIGMTQTELAEFLKEKEIYTAMNLDGGGSTTMVARRLGNDFIETINKVSGGTQRLVTNAIGIFNTSKTSSLSELLVNVENTELRVGESTKIEVKGYDKYYNPKKVDFDTLKWEIDGAEVTIEDGVITASGESGESQITVKKGKVKNTFTINILPEAQTFEEMFAGDIIGSGEKATKIVFYEEIENQSTLLAKLIKNKFEETINEEADAIVSLKDIKTTYDQKVISVGKYHCEDVENATFISIDMSNEGIRKTDYTQWINLQEDILNSTNKNVFVLLNARMNDFKDAKEKELFKETITSLEKGLDKNIFVIEKGISTNFEIIDGIKMIQIGNDQIDESNGTNMIFNSKYIEFNISEDEEFSYEFKNLY
ncbi:MAG: phosphodiester glycosidase family protein [Clostridia bacterium]|nr:phosphodiester glycosidase family protein [Clostridia bacterium]